MVADGPDGRPGGVPARVPRYVGSDFDPPSPLPPELEQGARTLIVEREPVGGGDRLDALAAPPFPKLVVTGAHLAAFDAVCDVLVERLDAERLVLPGYGHTAQRHPEFNERLAEFVRGRGSPDGAAEASPPALQRFAPLLGLALGDPAPTRGFPSLTISSR